MAKQNSFVHQDSYDLPVTSYSFRLQVEGVFDVPCKSVRGFSRENEFEPVQEGGQNDFVHMLRKPISRPFTFQVERYVGVDTIDPLPLGAELMLPLVLCVNNNVFPTWDYVRTYTFTGCVVTAKDYGTLDAEKSELLVETTTIAYREMVVVNVPTKAYTKDKKPFEEYKNEIARDRSEEHLKYFNQRAEEFNLDEESGDKRSLHAKRTVGDESSPIVKLKKDENAAADKKAMIEAAASPESGIRIPTDQLTKDAMIKAAASPKSGIRIPAGQTTKEKMEQAAKNNIWPPKRNARNIADYLSKK